MSMSADVSPKSVVPLHTSKSVNNNGNAWEPNHYSQPVAIMLTLTLEGTWCKDGICFKTAYKYESLFIGVTMETVK